MSTKLYSLLVIMLMLTACTSEEIMQNSVNKGGESVDISFSLDVPSVVVTKGTDVPNGEIAIQDLRLIAFDEDEELLGRIVPTHVSGDNWKASIPRKTKSIQFISNYSKWEEIDSPGYLRTTPMNEYVFWAEQEFTDGVVSQFDIKMLRNWAKIVLNVDESVKKKFTDNITYYVYNSSKSATCSPYEWGEVNNPEPGSIQTNPIATGGLEVNVPAYLFERDNQKKNPTFIILGGKYTGTTTRTYYKIDLSVTGDNGLSVVSDVIRNYQFNVSVKKVERAGVTWNEVIDPNKIPDYNVLTSVELMKYPSITYGNESLVVSKNTFVFTNSAGSDLYMTATYKKDNKTYNNLLEVITASSNLEKVINGNIEWVNKTAGTLHAKIKSAPVSDQEIKTSFYIKPTGSLLQRKITVILRHAYQFKNFSATPISQSKVGAETTLSFKIPEQINPANDPDLEALYPFECRIYTKKLYATTPGMRIESTGNGEYYYVYKIDTYNAAGYTMNFKTNDAGFEERISIASDLFMTSSFVFRDTPATNEIALNTNRLFRSKMGNSSEQNINGGTIYVSYEGYSGSPISFNTNAQGKPVANQSITLPTTVTDVVLTYSKDGITYEAAVKTSDLSSNGNTVLANTNVKYTLSNQVIYKSKYSGLASPIKKGTISVLYDGDALGNFTTNNSGKPTTTPSIVLPKGVTKVSLQYEYLKVKYYADVDISSITGTSSQAVVLEK